MSRRLFFLLFPVMVFTSCLSDRIKADLIIRNAVIYTADSAFSIQSAMAVGGGRILDVGTNDQILEKYQADSLLDAQGKFIYPGFIDAHCHFYGFALLSRYVDLSEATSFDQVLGLLKGYADSVNGGWITGRGWDQNNWPGSRFPDNKKLSALFPEIPVVLVRVDGHAVLVNEAAIAQSGITPDSLSDKKEAVIEKGKFTGIFLETMADRFRKMIPEPGSKELLKLIESAQEKCFAAGLTMLADAGLDARVIAYYDSLQSENRLKMAIYAMLSPTEENIEQYLNKGPLVKPKLIVRSVKLYADGALGSRGACLLRPYSDAPGNYGIMTITPEELGRICVVAYDHGYQVNTHAIGDSAVRTVLKVYSDYLLPGNDLRWRVEHAQVVNPGDFGLFGEFSIIPSVQATHATSDMSWAAQRLGPRRLRNAYAYKTLMNQNGWIPNGTDFPIEDISPVKTFYAAVTRKDANGKPVNGFQRENALTRQEALRSITIWAAKSCFEEKRRGSLEPGKNADFVITDRDIMQVKEKEILSARILKTVIDGETVYSENQ